MDTFETFGERNRSQKFFILCKFPTYANVEVCAALPLGHLCRNNMLYTIPLEKKTVRSERALRASTLRAPQLAKPPFPTYGVRPYVGVCLLGTFETIGEENRTQNFFKLCKFPTTVCHFGHPMSGCASWAPLPEQYAVLKSMEKKTGRPQSKTSRKPVENQSKSDQYAVLKKEGVIARCERGIGAICGTQINGKKNSRSDRTHCDNIASTSRAAP